MDSNSLSTNSAFEYMSTPSKSIRSEVPQQLNEKIVKSNNQKTLKEMFSGTKDRNDSVVVDGTQEERKRLSTSKESRVIQSEAKVKPNAMNSPPRNF